MINYEPRTPRALVGFAAVFMTAATLAVAVLAPAASDVSSREVTVWTMSSDFDGAGADDVDQCRRGAWHAARTRRAVARGVENQFAGLTGRIAVPHPSERQGLPVSGTVAAMS